MTFSGARVGRLARRAHVWRSVGLRGSIRLACILTVMSVFDRKDAGRLGWGIAAGALVVGYSPGSESSGMRSSFGPPCPQTSPSA
jgi:hypothetical protein